MRYFDTGATRDSEDDKLDYEGFLSPVVLERFAEYMHEHRKQADDKLRDSDNWQKGIPESAYMKSLWRHFMDVWKWHRGRKVEAGYDNALCAMMFNVQGLLFEYLKSVETPMAEEEIDKFIPWDELDDVTGLREVVVNWSPTWHDETREGFHNHPDGHGWSENHHTRLKAHDGFRKHVHVSDDIDKPVTYYLRHDELSPVAYGPSLQY